MNSSEGDQHPVWRGSRWLEVLRVEFLGLKLRRDGGMRRLGWKERYGHCELGEVGGC